MNNNITELRENVGEGTNLVYRGIQERRVEIRQWSPVSIKGLKPD